MRRITLALVVCVAGLSVLTISANAFFNQPTKGKSHKGNLMTAYKPCTMPNTMTDDGFQACTPPVRENPNCGFDGGQGKVQLKALTVGNTDFRIKLNGLDQFCEGQTLDFFIKYRKSGFHCGIADCTMVDTVKQLSSCSVNNSTCKANGQIFLPGGADQGQVEILDVYVEQAGVLTFRSGVITQRP